MRFACDQSNCDDSLGNSPADNHRPCKFGCESPGSLASATLSAIARFTIVHRAILTGLLTARLVRREPDCANRGCQDRKQDFEITLHDQRSLAIISKASGNRNVISWMRIEVSCATPACETKIQNFNLYEHTP